MLLSPGLYEEIRQCREACGEAHMKTILATGELGSLANVYKASMIAMMAGKYMWFSFEAKNVFAILFMKLKKFKSRKFSFADSRQKLLCSNYWSCRCSNEVSLVLYNLQKLHEMLNNT